MGTEALRSWEGEGAYGIRNRELESVPPVRVYKGLTFRNCGLGARERIVWGADGSLTCLFTLRHLGAQPQPSPAFQGPQPVVPTPTP